MRVRSACMDEFRQWAVKAAEWGVDYRARIRDLPVRPPVAPGDIAAQLAPSPPERGEAFEAVFADFERIIAPGMTNWQHPRFFASFPSNSAPASLVAEHLVNAIGAVHAVADGAGRDRARDAHDRLAAPGLRPSRRVQGLHPGYGVD